MDLVRHTIENVVTEYRNESTENFVFPAPSKEQMAMVAPLFKNENITPEAAYLVLLNFDRDPKDISTLDLENRVKVLKVIYKMLDNKEFSGMILNNLKTEDELKNADGMIKVLKRIVNLLIMESNTAHAPTDEKQKTPVEHMYEKKMDRMQSYTSHVFIFALSVIVILLCCMINKNK